MMKIWPISGFMLIAVATTYIICGGPDRDATNPPSVPVLQEFRDKPESSQLSGGIAGSNRLLDKQDGRPKVITDLDTVEDFTQEAESYDLTSALIEAETILLSSKTSIAEQDRLFQLQDELTVNASTDTTLREQLIALVRSDPTHEMARFALNAIARLDLQDVIDLAVELAQSADRDTTLAGLNLLSELKPETDQALVVAEQALNTFRYDYEVMVAAIEALPSEEIRTTTGARVLSSLNELISNEDDGVRSASIFAIADRAADSAELASVVQILTSEDPNDRISAALALESSDISTEDLRDPLVSRMIDVDELWEVRRIAADSLVRFNLTEDQKSQLAFFREEQIRLSLEG